MHKRLNSLVAVEVGPSYVTRSFYSRVEFYMTYRTLLYHAKRGAPDREWRFLPLLAPESSLVACEHVAMPGEGPYHPEDDEDDRVYCEHGRRADVCTLCPIPRPGSNS
jgi:hypothetical protein